MKQRSKDEVLTDIKELIASKGYIYSLCLILFEDFHHELDKIHQIDYRSKLSVKECSLILGFLTQEKIDFTIPDSPERVIELKEKTYELMKEFHFSFNTPQVKKIKKLLDDQGQGSKIEDSYDERFDFFVEDGGMMEPMFYAGDGVYDFQYLEYLERKYKYDKEWLLNNRGFDFQNTIQMVQKIRTLLHTKSKKVNLISLKELRQKLIQKSRKKFKNKLTDEELIRNEKQALISAEFYQFVNLFPPIQKNIISPANEETRRDNKWKIFYENLIDLFVIKKSQFENSLYTERFFENFSFSPPANKDYMGPGYFNVINSKPLIKLDEDRYFVPINYLVAEAIYESPSYWMFEDQAYKNLLAKHRGQVGEEITYDFLSKVFGVDNTYKSVKISSKKGETATDIDVLCLLGSKALCVQVKSKKLTLSAKRGDTDQLTKDFKGAVQDAYNQGLISRKKILDRNVKFYRENGEEMKISEEINDVYIMGITTENYPALTHQSSIMLQKDDSDPFPLFLSVFDLELLAHYLNDPYDFLYYVRQRTSLMDYFRADEEIIYLGYHLRRKLWKLEEADYVALDTDFGGIIDRNYYPFKLGLSHLLSDANDPIENRWKDENFNFFCKELKRLNHPKTTDIIFHLLDWSGESRKGIVDNIVKTKNRTYSDGQTHSIATSTPPDFGICYLAIGSNDIYALQEKLEVYTVARKYKSKCNAWVGIGSLKSSKNIIDLAIYDENPWEYDAELESISNDLLNTNKKRKFISLAGNKKAGRNDPCPCKSGLKYKKCCGSNAN